MRENPGTGKGFRASDKLGKPWNLWEGPEGGENNVEILHRNCTVAACSAAVNRRTGGNRFLRRRYIVATQATRGEINDGYCKAGRSCDSYPILFQGYPYIPRYIVNTTPYESGRRPQEDLDSGSANLKSTESALDLWSRYKRSGGSLGPSGIGLSLLAAATNQPDQPFGTGIGIQIHTTYWRKRISHVSRFTLAHRYP